MRTRINRTRMKTQMHIQKMPKLCSGTRALGFKPDIENIATDRSIRAILIYDRMYGSEAIDSDTLNLCFSKLSAL